MAGFVAITENQFTSQIFAQAPTSGVNVSLTPSGRQLNFPGGSLTEADVKKVFHDLENKMGIYSAAEMNQLLPGNAVIVNTQFLDLAVNVGLASRSGADYRFKVSDRVS
ncbi:MAG: hypothetical protein WBV69_06835 [Candidatus Sulfotelmatobacter sp.]